MQSNRQKVSFQDAKGRWFYNFIDLKDVYKNVHSAGTAYGSSANLLINEMLANLLDLVMQKKVNLKSLVITDYGCGRSKAANVLAMALSDDIDAVVQLIDKGANYQEIIDYLQPAINRANAQKINRLDQVTVYGSVTVQRYDIGIPEFSSPLDRFADVVFCNDVFEHIPYADIPAFIADLQAQGRYIAASISLRDAVNYSALPEEIVLNGATPVDKPEGGIVIEKNEAGAYIFSLHVSILPKEKWQELLGKNWHLLPAQDYTAVSALNYRPGDEYQDFKKDLISRIGFADFIPFPTRIGSRYEQDPILFRRTAAMQPMKHIQKLQALKEYPDSPFKKSEIEKSKMFLEFVGLTPNPETGDYDISLLPQDYLEKLYELERLAKESVFEKDTARADKIVAENARKIMSDRKR